MPNVTEFSYLNRIELLDKGIVDKSKAISGKELLELLYKEAPTYADFVKPEKFNRYFEIAICASMDASNPETKDYLEKELLEMRQKPSQGYIELVHDRNLFPNKYDTSDNRIMEARYWMYGGENKGWDFGCGTSEKNIKLFCPNIPCKNINNLGQVKTDYDLWNFFLSWSRRWRGEEK
jgi:hypothetical protein